MSLQQRRLLFYSFILLFLMIAPLAILYATGRTINWRQFEIQKTGSMIIETEPANADIFLNAKRPNLFFNQIFQRNSLAKTNTRLTNLAPATYQLRLELSGYIPWERKTVVKANEVTNIGPIRLFKNSKPELQYNLEKQDFLTSPDGRTVLTITGTTVTVFQVQEKKEFKLTLNLPTNPSIFWSENQENFVLNDTYIINRQAEIIDNLTTSLSFPPSFVRWGNDRSDEIYYIEKNKLFRFIFANNKNEEVIDINALLRSGDLYDYKVDNNHVHFALKKTSAAEIVVLYLNSPRQATAPLPDGTYHFISDAKNKILLLETKKKDLYLLEQPLPLFFSPRVTLVAKNYTVGWWDKNKVLYATPFEIREWNDNHEKLISRFGEGIIGVGQLRKNNEILLATKDNIQIIESGGELFNQTVSLLSGVEIAKLLLVNENDLYFIGNYNNTYGIYKLEF